MFVCLLVWSNLLRIAGNHVWKIWKLQKSELRILALDQLYIAYFCRGLEEWQWKNFSASFYVLCYSVIACAHLLTQAHTAHNFSHAVTHSHTYRKGEEAIGGARRVSSHSFVRLFPESSVLFSAGGGRETKLTLSDIMNKRCLDLRMSSLAYSLQIADLDDEIAQLQDEPPSVSRSTGICFVTFRVFTSLNSLSPHISLSPDQHVWNVCGNSKADVISSLKKWKLTWDLQIGTYVLCVCFYVSGSCVIPGVSIYCKQVSVRARACVWMIVTPVELSWKLCSLCNAIQGSPRSRSRRCLVEVSAYSKIFAANPKGTLLYSSVCADVF